MNNKLSSINMWDNWFSEYVTMINKDLIFLWDQYRYYDSDHDKYIAKLYREFLPIYYPIRSKIRNKSNRIENMTKFLITMTNFVGSVLEYKCNPKNNHKLGYHKQETSFMGLMLIPQISEIFEVTNKKWLLNIKKWHQDWKKENPDD